MFDNYRATHNETWLGAAQGAWDIIAENFLHVDGTSALTEGAPDHGTDWKAKTYPIRPGTGILDLGLILTIFHAFHSSTVYRPAHAARCALLGTHAY